MLSPDLLEVLERVQCELGFQLDVLDRDGGAYARSYAEAALTTRPGGGRPPRPRAMHPKVAAAIREMVLDELSALPGRRSLS